ncbi:MAG: nucleoside triphosphate pyrophosphatase [Vulcanimicrobiota bacterium]
MSSSQKPFVLASASPRRRQLLEGLGLAFQVVHPDEAVEAGLAVDGLAASLVPLALARAKTLSVASELPGQLVVGADTVVVEGDTILGKPVDDREATAMIARLAGRQHQVITAVAACLDERVEARVETTQVFFRPLASAEIAHYVRSGEGRDKAGAYGIQGLGSLLVDRIEGCYFNVVGLPLVALMNLLREFDLDLLEAACSV